MKHSYNQLIYVALSDLQLIGHRFYDQKDNDLKYSSLVILSCFIIECVGDIYVLSDWLISLFGPL